MASPPVGLDITPTSLAAVSLTRKGKAYGIVSHSEAPLPAGCFADGEVVDADALGGAIATYWAANKIKQRQVAVGIASQRTITRVVEKVRIKGGRRQLREALAFDVADFLPIPLEDAVWDFHTVGRWKHPDTGAEMERHVVVMAYRDSVERLARAITAAGLKLARIDLAGFALMRAGLPAVKLALRAEAVDEDPPIALVDIGPTSTNLVISRADVCELNRIVPFGRQHFTQTLVEQFGWTYEDAARVAEDAGVLPPGGVDSPGDPYADARAVMQYVADQLALELRNSFDYYTHASEGELRIGRLVVAGEGGLLRGIDQRFANELGVPVSILDPSPRLDATSVERIAGRQSRFGIALGLAMEEAA